MINKLPVNKTYLLTAAIILLLLVSYQLAFKNTISAWQLHRQLTAQLSQQTSLDYQPGYLERKSKNLDGVISKFKSDSVSFREKIVSQISALASGTHVKLSSLPGEDPYYHTPQTIIQRMDFEGDYFDLLKLQRQIEQTEGIGILRSVEIKSSNLSDGSDDHKRKMILWLAMIK